MDFDGEHFGPHHPFTPPLRRRVTTLGETYIMKEIEPGYGPGFTIFKAKPGGFCENFLFIEDPVVADLIFDCMTADM